MARGAAPNQSSTGSRGIAGRQAAPPAGSAALQAARRRRSTPNSNANAAAAGAPGQVDSNSGVLKFYTDDAPGLKIGPTTVLVLSLTFIGFVVLLHIWGKFRAA